MLVVARDDDHFHEVLEQNSSKTVVIDFTATWCAPCRHIAPLFERLSNEYRSIIFLKVDVDACTEVSNDLEGVPTIRVIKNSEKVDELVGVEDEELIELVKKYA